LEEAFANVGTISSNSGGSWFSTMLALSGTFASEIQARDAIGQWGKTGWLGKQQALFNSTPDCNHFYDWWYEYTLCVLDQNDDESDDWVKIVEDIIYKDYSLGETSLSGTRQGWAADKTLLLAASMLTSNVIVNEYGEGDFGHHDQYQYYQACHTPTKPEISDLRGAASCENDTSRFQEVTPVTFSGLAVGSIDKAPPFLPALKADEFFNVGYSEVILGMPI
jgi:hypothetical protein